MTQPADAKPDVRELMDAAEIAGNKAQQMVYDLCSGKERWVMRVPADEERDPDLVISNGLGKCLGVIAALRRHIEQMETELEQACHNLLEMHAEITAFRADAERYRWLREQQIQQAEAIVVINGYRLSLWKADLDKAIDAAIAQERK